MYNRILESKIRNCKKSVLLLGPRQVGKSTLISSLAPELEVNLANEKEYFTFQTELAELERRIEASGAKNIFIDEIQRIPRLTNTIQSLIDKNSKLKFYLTGSSARKLRKGKANLLPGRMINFQLAPLCLEELGEDWNEELAMRFGTLPGIASTANIKEKKQILSAYTNSYLKEEIMAEALVRQIDGFFRFLTVASSDSGRFVDFTKIAKRSKISRQTTTRHFEILEDTLIASKVENDPELDNNQVDLIKHPKFFFFDLGVLNALRGTFELNQERIGFLFEHLIYNQLTNSAIGHDLEHSIYNFRTRGGLEVDFIFKLDGKKMALECKATDSITSVDLSALKELTRYYPKINRMVIYRGKKELKESGIWILPLAKAIKSIFKS